VLLASLLAGGVGIDLTGASVVLHYDRWWNPAKENQATDRVHRIGQRRFVQVFKLITRDTIEERIDELIRAKVELMERVVAPTEDLVAGLDRSDLIKLLDLDLRAHAPGGTGDEGAAAAGGGP
jgi:SNF2 family DNA or RNA helicase